MKEFKKVKVGAFIKKYKKLFESEEPFLIEGKQGEIFYCSSGLKITQQEFNKISGIEEEEIKPCEECGRNVFTQRYSTGKGKVKYLCMKCSNK